MAIVSQTIREHDVVKLIDAVEKWPAGTVGTVVDERGESKLVEVADDRGVALDYVVVPAARLTPIE